MVCCLFVGRKTAGLGGWWRVFPLFKKDRERPTGCDDFQRRYRHRSPEMTQERSPAEIRQVAPHRKAATRPLGRGLSAGQTRKGTLAKSGPAAGLRPPSRGQAPVPTGPSWKWRFLSSRSLRTRDSERPALLSRPFASLTCARLGCQSHSCP